MLLANPCDAPLVNPIYPGSSSGYVTRFQKFFTVNPVGDATGTEHIFHFSPGSLSSSNVGVIVGVADTSDPARPIVMSGTVSNPGATFLNNNASSYRAIAACLRFTYTGAEMDRGGRIHYGHTQASLLDVGESTDLISVAPTLENYSRIPPESIELVWKPSEGDMLFKDPSALDVPQSRDTRSALTVAASAVGGSILYDMTVVYEWQPKLASNVSSAPFNTNLSTNTYNDVYESLLKAGFRFVRDAMHRGSADLLSRLAQNLGVMPTRTRHNTATSF